MKKIKILIITLLILGVLGGAGAYGYFKVYLPTVETRETILVDPDDNQIATLEVQNGSKIEILDHSNKVIQELIIDKDSEKLVIENGKDTADKLFLTYKASKNDDEENKKISYILTPSYETLKDYVLTVSHSDHVTLERNDKVSPTFKIPVSKGTSIRGYLPTVKLDENFKGNWYYQGSNELVNNTDILDSDKSIVYRTYQDKNNNFIDDYTEKFTITFVPNLPIEISSKIVGWEDTLSLPILSDDTKIFYEWYSDKVFTKKFTEETLVTSNLTLYAKIKTIDEVMNESVKSPIDRKDIALQVERILNDRNKAVDENYNSTIQAENAEREQREQYEKENNIYNTDRTYSVELANTALNKLYFISFIDENNNFIYGIVSPYGRTIKIYNTDGNMWKEYAVRNHTTITLDSTVLKSYSQELLGYTSEYYKYNDTIYVKITPEIKATESE